jgi:hypothetical protein
VKRAEGREERRLAQKLKKINTDSNTESENIYIRYNVMKSIVEEERW